LNVHRVSDVRPVEIHTSEPSHFEVEIAIAKLKRYESLGSDQIPAGGETLLSEIHKLINFYLKYGRIARLGEGVCYCTNLQEGL
jgi:hypothetical protein